MTLEADREAMIRAAAGWVGVGGELGRARGLAARGDARGVAFGALAQAAGIDGQHDRFIGEMLDCLAQGRATMNAVADALRSTARDFGATDTAAADTFHQPDGTPR